MSLWVIKVQMWYFLDIQPLAIQEPFKLKNCETHHLNPLSSYIYFTIVLYCFYFFYSLSCKMGVLLQKKATAHWPIFRILIWKFKKWACSKICCFMLQWLVERLKLDGSIQKTFFKKYFCWNSWLKVLRFYVFQAFLAI